MTAVYRMRGAGWLLACVAVVLGFYLVSLRVAAERKRLAEVETRIAVAHRDIRALETEFDTRANLVQLERWNGDTLALAAPTAAQFVRTSAELASIDTAAHAPGGATIRTAALVVPTGVPVAAPAAAGALPVPTTLPATASPAVIKVVSVGAAPSPAATRAMALVRPRAVAMLDKKLLSDATLGDLLAKAGREATPTR